VVEISPPDSSVPCLCLSASSDAVWCVLANGAVYTRSQVRCGICPQGRYWQHVNLEQLGLSLVSLCQCHFTNSCLLIGIPHFSSNVTA